VCGTVCHTEIMLKNKPLTFGACTWTKHEKHTALFTVYTSQEFKKVIRALDRRPNLTCDHPTVAPSGVDDEGGTPKGAPIGPQCDTSPCGVVELRGLNN
jgi:hypothetical protein